MMLSLLLLLLFVCSVCTAEDLPNPFGAGPYQVEKLEVKQGKGVSCTPPLESDAPCRPIVIFAPQATTGSLPTVFFLHGFVLPNEFYEDLLKHVASWGFIVVAPSLYNTRGGLPFFDINVEEELRRARGILAWCHRRLNPTLRANQPTKGVSANLKQLAVVGHSRGGKVATALSVEAGSGALNELACPAADQEQQCPAFSFAGVALLDPVDGKAPPIPPKCCDNGCITDPRLTEQSDLEFGAPTLVMGTGLGPMKGGCSLCLCPCAPRGLGHEVFYRLARTASAAGVGGKYHFVAQDYGHLDLLNDGSGNLATSACQSGGSRTPLRTFSGGLVVVFLKARMVQDGTFATVFEGLLRAPQDAPVQDIKNVTAEWDEA